MQLLTLGLNWEVKEESMEEEKKYEKPSLNEEVVETAIASAEEMTQEDLHGENLGDRVKVLSPGMMVAKRFFRSKLSVIGLITLIALFLFSFIGPLFSPWTGADGQGLVEAAGTVER